MVLGTRNLLCQALTGAYGRRGGHVGWVARLGAGGVACAFWALVVSAWVLGLVAAPSAPAAQGRALALSFPKAGEMSLSLESKDALSEGIVSGLGVNDTSHDVYVADSGHHRVDEFSSSGALIRAWGWGVATGASEFQICSSSCLEGIRGPEGTSGEAAPSAAPGQLDQPVWIAVDNDPSSSSVGDVYVGDTEDNLVTKFDAEGHVIASWGNNGENASHERVEPNGQLNGEGSPKPEVFGPTGLSGRPLSGMAVDESGDLWVYTREGRLFAFASNGDFLVKCREEQVTGGVEPGGLVASSGLLWLVDAIGRVQRLHQNECVGESGGSGGPAVRVTKGEPRGDDLALDSSTGDLFVDSGGLFIEDLPAICVQSGTLCSAVQSFGAEALSEGLGVAVDSGSGTVYVADLASERVYAFAVVVEATATAAQAVHSHSAVLRGEVNPLGVELTKCEFEYGETLAYGSVAPCAESTETIGDGGSPVVVDASVAGLAGGSRYHFRLRAVNSEGEARSLDEQVTTAKTARVVEVSAEDLTGSTALLTALVNPEGVTNGEYHFEYGECASLSACVSSPFPMSLPTVALGSNGENVSLQQLATGLSSHRVYHFRLVVEDENGPAFPDPEGTFVFEPAVASCEAERPQATSDSLPDCRSYEMVTPPLKNGALVYNGVFIAAPAISNDGSTVMAMSIQCFAEPLSCVGVRETEGEPYRFERTDGGWMTTPLAVAGFTGTTTISYNADTGLVLYAAPPSEGTPEDLYVRDPAGPLLAVGPLQEQPGLAVAGEAALATPLVSTGDDSHLAYAGRGLWAFDESTAGQVYEYPGVGGHPMLVAVTGPEKGSTNDIGTCGASLGGRKGAGQVWHTMSSDGRSVLFAVDRCAHGTGINKSTPVPAAEIYQRVERRDGSMTTIHVSVHASPAECDAECQATTPRDAALEGASSDGSRILFTSTQRLTDDASEDKRSGDSASENEGCARAAEGTSGCNLYLFECPAHCENEEAESRERVTALSAGDSSGSGPQVLGVVGMSDEGTGIYFVARGVLTGANKEGLQPSPGGENLYAYRSSGPGEGRLAFVGALAPSDEPDWLEGIGEANVSPDGRYLVFTSHRALTRDVTRAEGPSQVYRYDADTEELARVSIGEEGFNDDGNNGVGDARIAEPKLQIQSHGRTDPTMSDDGQIVFFQSPVGLTPDALNDVAARENPRVLAQNVYEWEADGSEPSAAAPACDQAGGCVWLISDGHDLTAGSHAHKNESAVELLGADSTGQNVFFETADQLVTADTDSQIDIYDARVDGGFPSTVEAGECDDLEECHHSEASPPMLEGFMSESPGTGNFSGGVEEHLASGSEHKRGIQLTPSQALAKGLHACRANHGEKARAACERQARAKYRARLLVRALETCRRKTKKKARQLCERQAHRRYEGHANHRKAA
jgi:hypothetical protein